MQITSLERQRLSSFDWRLLVAKLLLLTATFPVQVYAVPGFEVTPSLILAAFALVLFDPRNKLHLAVVGFLGLCGFIALFGMVGSEGRLRNLLGAASYSSGAPYILVGAVFASRAYDLPSMMRITTPAAVTMLAMLLVDVYLTDGNLVQSAAYRSTSYVSAETTFIASVFPFYGKYAVITLATVTMLIGVFSLASVEAYSAKTVKAFVLASSTALIIIAFWMWSRQVMLGVVIFYVVLLLIAFRSRYAWISALLFAVILSALISTGKAGVYVPGSNTVSTQAIASSKIARAGENIAKGDFNDLSTGRLGIYQDAVARLTPSILAKGCGFCNLVDVMSFQFSSLHNVPLTAIYKGGFIYASIYIGAAFFGLYGLWRLKRSFGRDVAIAALASLLAQSAVNDVLYFQVIPALLFSVTGYLLSFQGKKHDVAI